MVLDLDYAENLQRKQLINSRHVHEHETSETQLMRSFKCVQMLQKPAQHLEDINYQRTAEEDDVKLHLIAKFQSKTNIQILFLIHKEYDMSSADITSSVWHL